ncbi:MAG: hypothetical protein V2I97_14170 [Desulfococcaceae bacterium]|jgi:hypothetical protein|nr:hypothetical protein [Desulfococcaceae bacterium]
MIKNIFCFLCLCLFGGCSLYQGLIRTELPEELYLEPFSSHINADTACIADFASPASAPEAGKTAAGILYREFLNRNIFYCIQSYDKIISGNNAANPAACKNKCDLLIDGEVLYYIDGSHSQYSRVDQTVQVYDSRLEPPRLIWYAKTREISHPKAAKDMIVLKTNASPALPAVALMKRNAEKICNMFQTDLQRAEKAKAVQRKGNDIPLVKILKPVKDGKISFEIGEYIVFEGRADDPEDGELREEYLVWQSLPDGQIGKGTSFAIRILTPGVHHITLRGTDSEGAVGEDSVSVYVGNTAPEPEIISPPEGTEALFGEYILFEGAADDMEDGILEGDSLLWSSNINGQIGTGNALTSNLLNPGIHTITLTAIDSRKATGSRTISLTIREGDSSLVEIVEPRDKSFFEKNTAITFRGKGKSSMGNIFTDENLIWTSTMHQKTISLGTGNTVTVNDLLQGAHAITLTAFNETGVLAKDAITLYIGNSPPQAKIISPRTGAQYYNGNTIVFNGIGEDTEDGRISGEKLLWTSNINGRIGTGSNLTTDSLTRGEHIITLTATDRAGLSSDDAIRITVGNSLPTARILTPLAAENGKKIEYRKGEYIVFSGTAFDQEEGVIPGNAMTWTSSIDGKICEICPEEDKNCPDICSDCGPDGQPSFCKKVPCKCAGNLLRINHLSAGTHEIKLTAADSQGGIGISSASIHIFDRDAEGFSKQ